MLAQAVFLAHRVCRGVVSFIDRWSTCVGKSPTNNLQMAFRPTTVLGRTFPWQRREDRTGEVGDERRVRGGDVDHRLCAGPSPADPRTQGPAVGMNGCLLRMSQRLVDVKLSSCTPCHLIVALRGPPGGPISGYERPSAGTKKESTASTEAKSQSSVS